MKILTADLCDDYPGDVRVADSIFRHYGSRRSFGGPVHTIRVCEDNVLVRSALEEPGNGRVLIVDGNASQRCALVGGKLAGFALDNSWSGLIINGCIRDVAEIQAMDVGIRALGSHPMKSGKRGEGETGIAVSFARVDFAPGDFVYADDDGLIVSSRPLC